MQNRKEDQETSSDTAEKTLNDYTAEELEAEGLCSLFSYDDDQERKYQFHAKLNALLMASFTSDRGDAQAVVTRDKYFTHLYQERLSEYYLSLQDKLDKNEKLLAGEYYYYAMVTDNVNKLNVTALKRMSETYHIQNFDANLRVLIAAREWQEATEALSKNECMTELRQALEARGCLRRANCEMFLNLHGINLSGADLSMSSLDYMDLGNANLSHANLYSTGIHFSNLDHANLSNADCVRPDLKGRMEDAPNIRLTLARDACFDGMVAPNLDWRESDFSGSSFKNAVIGYGLFTKTVFDHCDFTNGILSFSTSYPTEKCSLRFINLEGGKLANVDYTSVDLSGAKFMPYTAFSNAESLIAALDIINTEVMEKLRTKDTSEWYRTSQINSFQMMMADNILYHLSHLSLGHTEKANIIEAALDHDLFLPEKYLQQLAFRTERNIYSFFTAQSHESYATEAVKMLEIARDEELTEDHLLRMN